MPAQAAGRGRQRRLADKQTRLAAFACVDGRRDYNAQPKGSLRVCQASGARRPHPSPGTAGHVTSGGRIHPGPPGPNPAQRRRGIAPARRHARRRARPRRPLKSCGVAYPPRAHSTRHCACPHRHVPSPARMAPAPAPAPGARTSGARALGHAATDMTQTFGHAALRAAASNDDTNTT